MNTAWASLVGGGGDEAPGATSETDTPWQLERGSYPRRVRTAGDGIEGEAGLRCENTSENYSRFVVG